MSYIASFNFKKSMFSDLSEIVLKINSIKIARKTSYVWKFKKKKILNPHLKEEITVDTRE